MTMIEEALARATDTKACVIGPGAVEATARMFCDLFPGVRKAIVVEDPRTRAVAGGRAAELLRAAGIDVAEVEPIPAESPLWYLDNLLITSHVAGNFHLPDILEQVVNITAENLRRYLAGQPLENVVDFTTGYKK